ncbi:OmpA family protein [Thioalkalivibrio sp. XN279]|uniref:OmpA family protein n=1 Tax=Thioalkalivibrio sp. XN279 TaxID=2714953 RepID=UPI00197F8F74|nr:OmpA family protein [Thioalkalivibrio sp. XN279]
MQRLMLTAVAAALVAGCQTIDPYTGEEKTASATKGAAIGAGAGALLGILTGDDSKERRKRALIGAGVGALAGGAVGNYMDQQEAELRRQLEGTGVGVTRVGDEIVLNMPGNITFETDSSDLKPQFFGVLDSVALVALKFDKTVVEVTGHTDSTGSAAYNQTLSEQRAATVATYLNNRGIDRQRILAFGRGLTQPIADNTTAQGRALNRRVEIRLSPITG